MMRRHALTFRGESHAIPASFGLCRDCGALVTMEQWLEATCPGVAAPRSPCTCPEHACLPDAGQAERYPVAGGYTLCPACYAHGHGSWLRLHYAGLLPDRAEAEDLRAELRATRKPD